MITKISTKGMSRDQWLEARRKSIGGSDAGAICGMNPYSSAYTVYADKLMLIPPAEDNEAMRQGRDLEEYVARRFCEEKGKRVKRDHSIIYNTDFPYSHADVDRLVVGEDAGLECKTASPMKYSAYLNGEIPDHYYVQCMHYIMVTGRSKWYLAVLVFQRGLFIFEIERNDEEIKNLAEIEADFWKNHVLKKTAPPPTGDKATTEAIGVIHPQSDGTEIDLLPVNSEIELYMQLKAQRADIDALIDKQCNIIKEYMNEAERGSCGDYRVTWKTQERSTFDKKRFVQEHPEIDLSEYMKKSTTRPFKIT